jgi:hypothetical protein
MTKYLSIAILITGFLVGNAYGEHDEFGLNLRVYEGILSVSAA